MVERQLRQRGIDDERVLAAMADVPREAFLPEEARRSAYRDGAVAIGEGQTMSQPWIVACMTELLELGGEERVLEVGTGYGFQTALLARLAARVFSVERLAELAETGRGNLARHGVSNAEVVVGDGTEGLPEHAHYEAIIVAAAFTRVPPPLAEQLAPGGRLVQPMGPGGEEEVALFEKERRGLTRRRTIAGAHFVRLYGTHGFPG